MSLERDTVPSDSDDDDNSENNNESLQYRDESYPDTNPVIQEFVRSFNREHYEACAKRAQELIQEKLDRFTDEDEAKVQAKLTHRSKTAKSAEAKLKARERRERPYRSRQHILQDIKDLAGVRVILHMPTNAQRKAIKKLLHAIWGPDVEERQYAQPISTARSRASEDTGDGYAYQGVRYQADHYRCLMNSDQSTAFYRWKHGDTVDIRVVSTFVHMWAEVSHDLLYKMHAFGGPTADEYRIMDSLNGVIVSGELLLGELVNSIARRTTVRWESFEQFSLFLRETDILKKRTSDDDTKQQPGFWDDLSMEGRELVYRLLVRERMNYPLAVRSILRDLGYPKNPAFRLVDEIDVYEPGFRPPHGLLTPFCIISTILQKTKPYGYSLGLKGADVMVTTAEKCGYMVDALTLLQMFAGSPESARSYLLKVIGANDVLKYSLEWLLRSPQRKDCLQELDTTPEDPEVYRTLDSVWAWFIREVDNLSSVCGMLLQLAYMGISIKGHSTAERLRALHIPSLLNTNPDPDEEPHNNNARDTARVFRGGFDDRSVFNNAGPGYALRAPLKADTAQPTETVLLSASEFYGVFLADHKDLRILHGQLLSKLGASRFIVRYRKILKSYATVLNETANTDLEKETAKMFGWPEHRRSMAVEIMEQTQARIEDNGSSPDTSAADDAAAEGSEDEGDYQEWASGESEEQTLTAADASRALTFLQMTTPLRELVLQVGLSLLPLHVKDIVEASPTQALQVFDETDGIGRSLFDEFKTMIEERTKTQWDWWPFQPRIPTLTRGKPLLRWELCGQHLYVILSPQDAALVRQVIGAMPNHTGMRSVPEKQSKRMTWAVALAQIRFYLRNNIPHLKTKPALGTTALSSASQRYTPSGALTTGQQYGTTPPIGLNLIFPTTQPPQPGVGNQGSAPSTTIALPKITHWVVFGVKDRRDFHNIETIGTHKDLKDPAFFQELKANYRKHRGWFRRLFSPYLFRHCHFVQFDELLDQRISRVGEALPDDVPGYKTDYDYDPRPPHTKPPIKEEQFSALLRACDLPCWWSLLPTWLHECNRVTESRRWLARIPRKKSMYKTTTTLNVGVATHSGRVAFGLQADYQPSFVKMAIYHLVPILSGVAFWIFWLVRVSLTDLQNASVPLLTVVALIATYWALVTKL